MAIPSRQGVFKFAKHGFTMVGENSVHTMLRIPLFSQDQNGQQILIQTFKRWAGKHEVHQTLDRMTYWIESPLSDNPKVVQYTSLHFDIFLYPRGDELNTERDEKQFLALLSFGLSSSGDINPKKLHEHFRPQKLLVDVAESGSFSIPGSVLSAEPKSVDFDEIQEWWSEAKLNSQHLPQVIIGKHPSSPLPIVDPRILAKLLAGVAKVHYAKTPSVMESINQHIGEHQIQPGSIRIIGATNSNRSVVYTPKRIREINSKFRRSVSLDIFIRLSLNGLVKNTIPFDEWSMLKSHSLGMAPQNIQSKDDFETIENLNLQIDQRDESIEALEQKVSELNLDLTNLTKKLDLLEQSNEEMESRNIELNSMYRDALDQFSSVKKKYKNEKSKNEALLPYLSKLKNSHGLDTFEELTGFLENLAKEEVEEEGEEINQLQSVTDVLEHVKLAHSRYIVVLDSAMKSARQSTFQPPNRVLEVMNAMVEKYGNVVQRANKNQSLDFEKILRETKAAGTLRVANKESKPTMQQFGDQRSFRYKKKLFEMQTHIKIGTQHDQSKTLRIHFMFDKKSKKYIIGHCGKHLDTASSN